MMLLTAMLFACCSLDSEVKAQSSNDMTQKNHITIDGVTKTATQADIKTWVNAGEGNVSVTLSLKAPTETDDLNSLFSRESFSLGTTTLSYRKAEICHETSTQPLLALYLHGGTARGNDNEAQLKEAAVGVIYNYLQSHGISATMIVPQCPAGGGWTNQLRRVVNELLKDFVNEGTVDADRVYVMGGSMGGTGTWCQLSYFSDFYAAAMPVAGNPADCDATNVATTPVLTVMGTADNIMSIPTVEAFRDEVETKGGTIRLDIEQGWTHANTCEQSYTDERLDWLFSQIRSGESSIQSQYTDQHTSTHAYSVSGVVAQPGQKGIIIKKGEKIIR